MRNHLFFIVEEKIFDFSHRHLLDKLSWLLTLMGVCLCMLGAKQRAASLLTKACRFSREPRIAKLLIEKNLITAQTIGPRVSHGVHLDEAASRTIIIKSPLIENGNISEKGILIITFTKTFSFYLRNVDIEKLSRYFHIVLEPSWSGYFDPDILGWVFSGAEQIFVQSTDEFDRISLNAAWPNLIPVSFGASNWVDHFSFKAIASGKVYDSIYVANTTHAKRILRYMRAIKKISRTVPLYKGCLVCASWGGNSEIVKKLVRYFKIEKNIELHFSVNKEKLCELLNQSKVNILLSFKEGSNRSLFEAMFCNIPVICISENVGVNKSYINEHTGLLVSDFFLEESLLYMATRWLYFSPRDWAMQHISPEATTKNLVELIRRHNPNFVFSITDILIKTNNPEVSYLGKKGVEFKTINKKILKLFLRNTSSPLGEIQLLIEELKGAVTGYNHIGQKQLTPPPHDEGGLHIR